MDPQRAGVFRRETRAMGNDTFTVERRTTISGPPTDVYRELVDFRRWREWSPWEGLDPTLQRTYSGPDVGVGSRYAWVGNRKVGAGSMEITATDAYSSVEIRLEFLKPFKATNQVHIQLDPSGDSPADGGSTRVTWTMTGPKTLATKIMGVFWSMDKMVGGDFERGLAQLKALVETTAEA